MIEVRLTPEKVKRFDHEVHIANWVMSQLKAAGVPMVGVLFPRVESGTLTVTYDEFDTGDWIYRWRE